MSSKKTCKTLLKILTGKEYVLFTDRANTAIDLSFQVCAGRSHVLKQEDGGWMTYLPLAQKNGFEVTSMVTLDGSFSEKELLHYGMDEILIVHSLAAYLTPLDMKSLYNRCITQDIFLINDVSGSIGLDQAKYGDIVLGSFGKAKPVALGKGGFLATNNKELFDTIVASYDEFEDLDFSALANLLESLQERREKIESIVSRVKQDLVTRCGESRVLQPATSHSLVAIVRFDSDREKEDLIAYCDEQNLEYTVCPREIRILDDAISIEVKRLFP